MRSQQFIKLYERPLRKVFFLTLKEATPEYRGWVNIINTDNAFDDDFKVSEFGTVPVQAEGSDVQYEAAIPGDIKRYITTERGLGYIITRKMRDDDKTSTMVRMTQALRRSFRHLFETEAAGIFNNATSTSSRYLGMDSAALISTSHSLLDGTNTYANRPSSDVDFSDTALQNAVINFFRLKGEQNLPVHVTPKLLWGDGGQMFDFAKVTKNEYEPDSGDRNKNYTRQGAVSGFGVMDYVASRYASDTDAWFLLSDKANHSMNLVIRINPEFEMGNDFSSGNIQAKGYCRLIAGFSDWRGVYGSTGA
jgi:hypothetical protein